MSVALCLVFAGLCLVLAACGSSSSSSSDASSGSSTTSAGTSAPEPATSPPNAADAVGISTPLTRKPPTGKTIAWLECELPDCAVFRSGHEEAAAALGWNFKLIPYKTIDPEAPEKAMNQAISEGVDYIAISAVGEAAFGNALKAAEAKGIPVISLATADKSKPSGKYTSVSALPWYGVLAKNLADWGTNHSGGNAHVLFVNIPEYPVLAAGGKLAEKAWATACPSCSFEELGITGEEIGGGQVGGKIVAFLQAHPDINYIQFSTAGALTGVIPSLESAGYAEKITITTVGLDPEIVNAVTKGQISAVAVSSTQYAAWVQTDVAARLSVGMELEYDKYIGLSGGKEFPTWILESASEANKLQSTGDVWPGPTGFQEVFKKLWHVG